MKNSNIVYVVIVLIVAIVGYMLLSAGNRQVNYSPQNKPEVTRPPAENTTGQNDLMGGQDKRVEVTIQNSKFDPEPLKIKRGTLVMWTNKDDKGHNVTADGGAFKSILLNQGEIFAHTFETAGEFKYSCTLHPEMKGTVIVE